MSYAEALKKLKRASKATSRATTKQCEAHKAVEVERGKLSIECNCEVKTPVKDIPFLKECVPGYSYDDYDYSYRNTWICPACGDEYQDWKDDDFPEGIEKYCNRVYKWQQWETKEVTKLRKRWRDRKAEEMDKKERQRKIKAAKKLLAEEGID